MRPLERLVLVSAATALAASTSSCFAVADLDRFEKKSDQATNFNGLNLTVRGMTSHVNELFEYRVVDSTNTLQSRGFIVPLGGVGASMFAPGAVPKQNGPFTLDFYADHDFSGGYHRDPVLGTGDHSWRLPLTPDLLDDNGDFVVVFDHNTSFFVITNPTPPREIGLPATVRLGNMGDFVGKRVEVRIADANSKRVVALYRVPELKTASQNFTIPGMIEAGVTYSVEVYTDNGASPPIGVRAFRINRDATPTGLELDFNPASAPQVDDAPRP